jgi:uncharacterized membrane protein SpoIIM required for sporulation
VRIEAFVADREADWAQLEALIARARGRPERLDVDEVNALGRLYRAVTADLALARQSLGSTAVTRRLESLTASARVLVYQSAPRTRSLSAFARRGYWQEIRARPRPLLTIAALMVASTALSAAWALHDPGAALSAVPSNLAAAGNPAGGDPHLSGATSAALSSVIFTNNIRVAILEFAGGIVIGVGALGLVAYNGLILGVVIGLGAGAGHSGLLAQLLVPHGVLELSLNVVCATAGARIGWALVEPGSLTRLQALAREARTSIGLLLGTAPWFVLAGLVEGFVTPARIGIVPALILGFGLGGLYWGLVWRLGRPVGATAAALTPALAT